MDRNEDIAARLIRLRLAKGYEQAKAFAERLGISEGNWNHFERARRKISIEDALKVCQKTGVSLDWIYRGIEHTLPRHVQDELAEVPEQTVTPPRRVVHS
jgi:transcriptional regulator with XRE-family HTH domain